MPNLYKGFVFDGILFAAIRWAVVGAAKTAPTKKLSYYSCWTGFAVGQGGASYHLHAPKLHRYLHK
jgi:hypothetical protein